MDWFDWMLAVCATGTTLFCSWHFYAVVKVVIDAYVDSVPPAHWSRPWVLAGLMGVDAVAIFLYVMGWLTREGWFFFGATLPVYIIAFAIWWMYRELKRAQSAANRGFRERLTDEVIDWDEYLSPEAKKAVSNFDAERDGRMRGEV